MFLVCFSLNFSLRYKYCQLLPYTDWNFGNFYCSWYLCFTFANFYSIQIEILEIFIVHDICVCALSPKMKEPRYVPSQLISCCYFMHSFFHFITLFFLAIFFMLPLTTVNFNFNSPLYSFIFCIMTSQFFFVFFKTSILVRFEAPYKTVVIQGAQDTWQARWEKLY